MLSHLKKIINRNSLVQRYKINNQASRLSSSIKRLDISAAQMAHLLSLDKKITFKNKICWEIGGGWIFSHAIVMHLLGAKQITITDIEPLARPEYIKQAIQNSSISVIRDILSPYEDHSLIRERLNKILSIKHFNFRELEKLNIEYKAPFYPEKETLTKKFDFIFSNVVLEYLTEDSLTILLQNIKHVIHPTGEMLHTIHMEDHASMNPFDYLKEDASFYSQGKYKSHSNRIRFSSYDNILENSGWKYKYLYKWQRLDSNLPGKIDNTLKYVDEKDLRTSHFCVHMKLNNN